MTDSYEALQTRDPDLELAGYGYSEPYESARLGLRSDSRAARWRDGARPAAQRGSQRSAALPGERPANQADEIDWRRLGSCKRLARGEFLYQQGDSIERFYVVEAGVLLLKRFTSDGREQVLEMVGAGEPTDLAFAGAYDHGAEAANDVVVRVISMAELQRSPAMMRFLLTAAQDRARNDRDHIFMLGRLSAEQRLARFLLHLVAKLASPENEEDGEPRERAMLRFIPSRQQVADFTGLTLETVSRQLSQWRKDGRLEEQRGKSLRLTDLEFFQGLANV